MEKVYCVYTHTDGKCPFLCAIAKNEKTANRLVEKSIKNYIEYGKQHNRNPITCNSDYGYRCVIFSYPNGNQMNTEFYFKEENLFDDDDKED